MLGEHPTFDNGDTTTRTDDNAGNVSIDQFQPDIFNVIRNEKANPRDPLDVVALYFSFFDRIRPSSKL